MIRSTRFEKSLASLNWFAQGRTRYISDQCQGFRHVYMFREQQHVLRRPLIDLRCQGGRPNGRWASSLNEWVLHRYSSSLLDFKSSSCSQTTNFQCIRPDPLKVNSGTFETRPSFTCPQAVDKVIPGPKHWLLRENVSDTLRRSSGTPRREKMSSDVPSPRQWWSGTPRFVTR